MKTRAGGSYEAARRRASAFGLCLCLVLGVCWRADTPVIARPQAETRSRELEEARQLDSRATGLYGEGKYDEAVPLAERALALREKALGPEHPLVASALNNLASLHDAKGDYAKAEPLYLRAAAIWEKALGPDHPELARAFNNLAALYDARGDYPKAEPLYVRALAILEKALGPEHADVASTLNNLAALYYAKGDYVRAEPLYLRAVATLEKVVGPDHPDVATPLDNLAALYDAAGDYARAEPLYLRALAVREKALGADHPDVSTSLNNLAVMYDARGDYARAEPSYLRALAISEKALGPTHSDVAVSLNNLAVMYEASGDYARAVRFASRSQEVRERNLALILATGSERQKLAYLATLSGETYSAVSLHARSAPSDPLALRLSLTTVLRRKGRALDAMSDQVASLRKRLDPQDRALLDRLSAAQSELSSVVLGGPGETPPAGHRAAVSRIESEVERLQDAVSRRSAEFRLRALPVTIEQVQGAIPAGAALAEFFSYRPTDAKARTQAVPLGPARYVAYVLRREGDPLWVDLGEAEAIDAAVSDLRAALNDPASKNYREAARSLDERVMRPVRKLTGEARQVFVSPDGALNLVPFAALVDENDRYLVETYSLTYLTSGRDLLRLQLGSDSRQPPLVVADPAFGDATGPDASGGGEDARARRSGDTARMSFLPLRGTAEEAKALAPMLAGARVLTRAGATEAALKRVAAPRVLHVATHGFFLPDSPPEDAEGASRNARGGKVASSQSPARVENPLLRSGLALEGANLRRGANGEDGILTALEAAGLDLWGTKLVVLSACETGVGEVRTGEGVYGLRRALVLAGSESQVMSLWKVADEATRDLMVAYYRKLMAGEGRTEALRRVQLEMLRGQVRAGGGQARGIGGTLSGKGSERSHPYFWAAFIQSGDWRAIAWK